jgi:DNA polymerase-3 subunit delta'
MHFDIKEAQPEAWKKLLLIWKNNRVGTAYLFSGPRGCGKEALAIEFGALLNNDSNEKNHDLNSPGYIRFKALQHEHLKLVVPFPAPKTIKENQNALDTLSEKDHDFLNQSIQKKSQDPFYKIRMPKATRILIHSVRELRRSLYLKTTSPGRKIVLIFDAHLLSVGQAEAANALLKILEEPPPDTTLLLVSDHKHDLLPTILSRCQNISVRPLDREIIKTHLEEIGVEKESADFYSVIAQGDMQRALSISDLTKKELVNLIHSIVLPVTGENPADWRRFINTYSRMSTSAPDEFKFHLYLLQLWFRAVSRRRNGFDDDLFIPELLTSLETFNSKYPLADLKAIDILLENSIDALRYNLYMSLTLTNCLVEIRKQLQGSSA